MKKICLLLIAAVCLPMMFSCNAENSKKDTADKTTDVKSQIVGIWQSIDREPGNEFVMILKDNGEILNLILCGEEGYLGSGHYDVKDNTMTVEYQGKKIGTVEINIQNDGNSLIVNEPDGKVFNFNRISQERYDQLTSNITDWNYD